MKASRCAQRATLLASRMKAQSQPTATRWTIATTMSGSCRIKGDPKSKALVVEVTPRVHDQRPGWSAARSPV